MCTPSYTVAEPVGPADVYLHPRSSMPAGEEWLTARELRVELLGPTQVTADEILAEEEEAELRKRLSPPPVLK
ncbi:MAG: hypothetical protein ACUVWR_06170 [Anaerolineae bacterium]